MNESDTAGAILDIAERLVQTRGYNGFSYADVAGELGVTKAALHYHFAGKGDLGVALLARYTDRFFDSLADVEGRGLSAAAKLDGYCRLYLQVLRGGRMCLCGMLAAEYQTLPVPMQQAVVRFFDRNERWLVEVLEAGRADGSIHFVNSAEQAAEIIVGDLEGAMLIARLHGDVARFESAVDRLLRSFHTPV